MSTFSRRNEILLKVEQMGLVDTDILSEELNVSASTIRRDLVNLANKGLITKVHGGATKVTSGNNIEISKNKRFVSNLDKKKKICDLALKFIKNSNTIFLDSSSTCYELAKKIGKFKDLSVVSNGLQSLGILSEYSSFRVYSISGEIKNNADIVGPLACQSIKNYSCDLVFFSCSAFSNNSGLTDATLDNCYIKKEMINNSYTKIALIDSTKFNKNFFAHLANIDQIDYLITDKRPEQEYLELLKGKLIY